MPHFFFDLTSNGVTSHDDIGVDFHCVEDAYLDVYWTALEMGYEKLRRREDPYHDAFDILDNDRRPLMHVPFSEVIGSRRQLHEQQGPPAHDVRQCIGRNKALRAAVQAELHRLEEGVLAIRAQLSRARRQRD
jgi:hypothetical protein